MNISTDDYVIPGSAHTVAGWLPKHGPMPTRVSKSATLLITDSRNHDQVGTEVTGFTFDPDATNDRRLLANGYYVTGHIYDPENKPLHGQMVVAPMPHGNGVFFGRVDKHNANGTVSIAVNGSYGDRFPWADLAIGCLVEVPTAYPCHIRRGDEPRAQRSDVETKIIHHRTALINKEIDIQYKLINEAIDQLDYGTIRDLVEEGQLSFFKYNMAWNVTFYVYGAAFSGEEDAKVQVINNEEVTLVVSGNVNANQQLDRVVRELEAKYANMAAVRHISIKSVTLNRITTSMN